MVTFCPLRSICCWTNLRYSPSPPPFFPSNSHSHPPSSHTTISEISHLELYTMHDPASNWRPFILRNRGFCCTFDIRARVLAIKFDHVIISHIHVQALPPTAQCLFLRLLQRRGPTFRMASLKYAEVGDAAEAAACLQAVGMAELLGADDWPDILQVSSSDLRPYPCPGGNPIVNNGAYFLNGKV